MNGNEAGDADTFSQPNTTGFLAASQPPVHASTAESPAVFFPVSPLAPATATQEVAGSTADFFSDSPPAPPTDAADATDFADVQLELPADHSQPLPAIESHVEAAQAVPAVPSETAAVPKSIWKMLSLRSAKPVKETSKATEPLVQDSEPKPAPASSQASHNSMQSGSLMSQAAQADSQLQPSTANIDGDTQTANSVAEQQDSTGAYEQSAAATGKRFGFLSSFRRTTAQPVGQLSWQVNNSIPEASVTAQDALSLQTAVMDSQLTSDGTSLVSFLDIIIAGTYAVACCCQYSLCPTIS